METIYYTITDNGDGSSGIIWFKFLDWQKLDEIAEEDEYGSFGGSEVNSLQVPSVEEFMKANNLTFWEDEDKE